MSIQRKAPPSGRLLSMDTGRTSRFMNTIKDLTKNDGSKSPILLHILKVAFIAFSFRRPPLHLVDDGLRLK